jgi:hypothetical protein
LGTGLELWELYENLKNAAAKGYKMRKHLERTFPARGFCRECSKFELPSLSFSPFPCAACLPPVPALRCVAAPPSLYLSSPESYSTVISLLPVSVSSASAFLFTSAFFCGKICQVELTRCFPRFFWFVSSSLIWKIEEALSLLSSRLLVDLF